MHCSWIAAAQHHCCMVDRQCRARALTTKVVADAAGNALLAEQDHAVAEDAAQYLVERLSAITALAEGKSAGVQLVPWGLDGRFKPASTLLFDVA